MTIGEVKCPGPLSVNVPVINPGAIDCDEVPKFMIPPAGCPVTRLPVSTLVNGCPERLVPSVVAEAGCVECVPHDPLIQWPRGAEGQAPCVRKIWELSSAV